MHKCKVRKEYTMTLIPFIKRGENHVMCIIIVCCHFATVCSGQDVTCAEDEILYNGRCYYFHGTSQLGRDDAIHYCRNRESHLVSVPDENTNAFLIYISRQYGNNYWIGLRRFDTDTWGWNNGSVDLDIPWGNEQPVTGPGCARMASSGRFYTFTCDELLPFICERDDEPIESENTWTMYNRHWYYRGGHAKPMSAARTCISKGAYLARITSNGERQLILDTPNLWTGITPFVWDDGTGYNWNIWAGGSVSNYPTSNTCVALHYRTQRWINTGCTKELHFICAHDLATTEATTSESTTTTPSTTVTTASVISRTTESITPTSNTVTHNLSLAGTSATTASTKSSDTFPTPPPSIHTTIGGVLTRSSTGDPQPQKNYLGVAQKLLSPEILIGVVLGGALLIIVIPIIVLVMLNKRGIIHITPCHKAAQSAQVTATPEYENIDDIVKPKQIKGNRLEDERVYVDYEDVSEQARSTAAGNVVYYNLTSKPSDYEAVSDDKDINPVYYNDTNTKPTVATETNYETLSPCRDTVGTDYQSFNK